MAKEWCGVCKTWCENCGHNYARVPSGEKALEERAMSDYLNVNWAPEPMDDPKDAIITSLQSEAAALRAEVERLTLEKDARIEKLPVTTCDQCQVCGHDIARPCAAKDIRLWLQQLAKNSRVTHSIDYLMVIDKRLSERDALAAEVERLRAMLDRIHNLDDFPELTSGMRSGLFCGVEDRNLTDRYEGAKYGWDDAAERCAEWAKSMSALAPAPQAQGLCYPFSTTTCNRPECKCREEKRAAPQAQEKQQ